VAKVEAPKLAATPKIEPPKEESAPPPSTTAPSVAPPSAELPAFEFEGGKTVVTTSDPIKLYKGLLEDSLRLNWDRPKDMDDHNNEADVEVSVDAEGNISDPVWKKSSGQKKWDDSVREAIASTPKVSRPPPKGFPPRAVIRFDVQEMAAVGQ
jgi:TonB family protein